MNRTGKLEFLKKIIRGEVSKQALNPPEFKMRMDKEGVIRFTIDGKQVTKEFFHSERKRLFSDFSFDIQFRSSGDES